MWFCMVWLLTPSFGIVCKEQFQYVQGGGGKWKHIKAFTWRFVLDGLKLRKLQGIVKELCNGRCPRDVFIRIPLDGVIAVSF